MILISIFGNAEGECFAGLIDRGWDDLASTVDTYGGNRGYFLWKLDCAGNNAQGFEGNACQYGENRYTEKGKYRRYFHRFALILTKDPTITLG